MGEILQAIDNSQEILC